MKQSIKRIVPLVVVLAVVFMSAAAVSAEEDTVELPHFTDGRINNFDINAPVAIFTYFDYPYADDINLGVLNRIEFWGLLYDGSIDKVLEVSAEDISSAEADGESIVATNYGYTLYLESDGSLTLVAPNFSDGSTYQYNWTLD